MLRWCYAMNISFIFRIFHSYDIYIWYWDISPTYYTLSWFVHCQSSPPSSDYSLAYPRPISTRKYPQKIARKVGCSGIGDVLSKLFSGPVFKAGVCLFRLKPAGYWSNNVGDVAKNWEAAKNCVWTNKNSEFQQQRCGMQSRSIKNVGTNGSGQHFLPFKTLKFGCHFGDPNSTPSIHPHLPWKDNPASQSSASLTFW